MKTTTNYGLKKPDGTDLINIEDLNSNADVLDTKLKEAANHAADDVKHITSAERSAWNGKAGTAVATPTANGLMAAADKVKLNGIAAGANHYIHPAYAARPSGLYKVTVDSTGHVSGTAAVTKGDLGALGLAATGSYTATISTTWSGSAAPYTQVVTVSGLLTTDKQVHITPDYSTALATSKAQQEAWNLVSKGDVTANNQITLTCFGDKPMTAVPVKLEVTR